MDFVHYEAICGFSSSSHDAIFSIFTFRTPSHLITSSPCLSFPFFQSLPLFSSCSTLSTPHLASSIAIPTPPFPFLHSRHSELFSMSSFIADARSQLQLITEHRAGGTRSAFRSALSLHFAINPFHTKPPPPPPPSSSSPSSSSGPLLLSTP